MPAPTRIASAVRAAVPVSLALAAAAAWAQVGEVEFARGVGFVQAPGQVARTLGKGVPLREGDRLTTAEGASAIIRLEDGTRMTVRPNSELVLQQYRFKESAPDNGMLMQLLRGGFRAVTGLISKASPNAARVQTSTATIGIRGTDFDARVCSGTECARESAQVADPARPNTVLASAKVVGAQGDVSAVDATGHRRRLVDGAGVYPGDVVETAAGTRALLAFRDGSRITLGAATRFRVDNFVYDRQNAADGRFLASLLKGSMRAFTGLIAKANNRNVGFATATATIGIRGTGFDATCTGACAGEQGGDPDAGLTLYTWLGAIEVTPEGRSALQLLQAGQGLFISPSGIVPVYNEPSTDVPRPDTATVPDNLFSTTNQVQDTSEGLFVYVRDGHIELATASQVLELGRGEAGYAGNDGQTGRPIDVPKFLDFDMLPMPTTRNPLLVTVFRENGIQPNNQCR